MAQNAHNELCRHVERAVCFNKRPLNPSDHGFKGNAPCSMTLRVKKDLCMPYILEGGFFKVGNGQVIEILFRDQDCGCPVINIKE